MGIIKCNVDAGSFRNNSVLGYETCFRNHLGKLLTGKFDFLLVSVTILEAESISLLESMKTITLNGMQVVLFETGKKNLADVINSFITPQNEFGDLVKLCRKLLNTHSNFVVSYTQSHANKSWS